MLNLKLLLTKCAVAPSYFSIFFIPIKKPQILFFKLDFQHITYSSLVQNLAGKDLKTTLDIIWGVRLEILMVELLICLLSFSFHRWPSDRN